jgi:repressor LexA
MGKGNWSVATSKTTLTTRQQHILAFLKEFVTERGYPPTVRDIANALSISSTSVVDYNLGVLVDRGYIRRTRDISRGIELLEGTQTTDNRQFVSVPVIGKIAAGQPIEAIAGEIDRVEVSSNIAPEGAFALRVKGKSMIEDLIDDGDIVVIRPQENARNGDIVVALLTDGPTSEGQATLKRFYREKDAIRLQPANAEMEPIFVHPRDLMVQGKVIAVIRQMA